MKTLLRFSRSYHVDRCWPGRTAWASPWQALRASYPSSSMGIASDCRSMARRVRQPEAGYPRCRRQREQRGVLPGTGLSNATLSSKVESARGHESKVSACGTLRPVCRCSRAPSAPSPRGFLLCAERGAGNKAPKRRRPGSGPMIRTRASSYTAQRTPCSPIIRLCGLQCADWQSRCACLELHAAVLREVGGSGAAVWRALDRGVTHADAEDGDEDREHVEVQRIAGAPLGAIRCGRGSVQSAGQTAHPRTGKGSTDQGA